MEISIYFIHCRYSQAAGYGIGTFLSELTRILHENGLAVSVVELGSNDQAISETEINGIKYIRLPAVNDFWKQKECYLRNAAYILSSFIEKKECPVFHFNFLYHFPMATKLKELYPGCRLIVTIHYIEWQIRYPDHQLIFYEAISKKKNARTAPENDLYEEYTTHRHFFELADRIVCLSDQTVSLLENTYGIGSQKLRLIRNGLRDDPVRLLTLSEKERKKEEWGFGKQEQLILYAGRLSVAKGLDVLIGAFKQIAPEFLQARLVIAGGGQLEEWIIKAAGCWKQITFTGRLEQKNCMNYTRSPR